MGCDICGKEAKLYKTKIEGSELEVCSSCGSINAKGQKKQGIVHHYKKKRKYYAPELESTQRVVQGYAEIIKGKREKLGLKQEDFAKKISERVSLIHKFETGSARPSIEVAKKIGKFLGVKLTEDAPEQNAQVTGGKKSDAVTIGDMIKIKK